jgi:predicted Zn-dependent protease
VRYENPEVDHAVNVTPGSPGRDFLALAVALVALAAALAAALVVGAGLLAKHVPFGAERVVASKFFQPPTERTEIERALQALADDVAAMMQLPPGMGITVHYADVPTVNAVATLGGHVVIYRGLLAKIGSEDALVAVLAHEIAHVRHRDPITGLGRGVALAVALGTLSASAGDVVGRAFIGGPATLTTLTFSRDQERDADTAAFEVLAARYGHLGGATALFDLFAKLHGTSRQPPAMLATHPGSEERVSRVRSWAGVRGVPAEGGLRPLQAALQLPAESDVKRRDE